MRNRCVIIALSFVLLISSGCGGSVGDLQFRKLKAGQTVSEVEAVLGKDGKDIPDSEVTALVKDALMPKIEGKGPKLEMPDMSGARGVRWGDDKKSITVIFVNDRASRIFKKGF